MAGRVSGSRNIAPYVRATFMRLSTAPEGENPKFDFEAALLRSLQENFTDTMRMLKGYVPTELLLQGDSENPVELETVFTLQLVSAKGEAITPAIEGDFHAQPIPAAHPESDAISSTTGVEEAGSGDPGRGQRTGSGLDATWVRP